MTWEEEKARRAEEALDTRIHAIQEHRAGLDETPRETGRFEEDWGRQEGMLP